jgi:hypothetical protein
LILIPDGASALLDMLTMDEVQVSSREQIQTHYALPAASTLMPGLGPAGEMQYISLIVPLPTPWVPYFMDSMSPEQAWRTMNDLISTLETEAMRNSNEYLSAWCAAACIRSGGGANQRLLSQLDVPFESPTAPDRKVTSWAKRRIAPFRIASDLAPLPQISMPGPDPALLWGSLAGMTSSSAAKQFSELEHTKIRAMSSLTEVQYDTMRPPIYSLMLAEGRSMAKVDTLLHQCLVPPEDSEVPVHIFVTQDMVRDLKDLRFGWNGDMSFETCHRGISPFAVVAVNQENASRRKRAQERARRATHLTPGDVENLETLPGLCPHNYDGLPRLLSAYLRFLRVLCGSMCNHYLEVVKTRRMLCKHVAIYEAMSPADVAQVMWSIFMDARHYYSNTMAGPLPTSNLVMLRMYL